MFRKIVWLVLMLNAHTVFAQQGDIELAKGMVLAKDYKKAIEEYQKLYAQNMADVEVYRQYFDLLLEAKEFRKAEQLIGDEKKLYNTPLLMVDMGRIYMAQDKKKKAEEIFDAAIQNLNGDDLLTQQMANAFTKINRDDYALKTYERARDLLHNAYMYSGPLARLYAKAGQIENAVSALLDGGNFNTNLDDVKATLLEILGTDQKKIQLAQKAIVKKINEQPENPFYAELLTWLFTQKNDWDGAFIQISALDERNREQGERVLEFARYAAKESQYEFALKAYDAIIEKGKELPYYTIAQNEKITVKFAQLQNNPAFTKQDVQNLVKDYVVFFEEFPQYYTTQTLRDYAKLEAQYADSPAVAIKLLQKGIDQPGARRDFIGLAKLQMGDYYVLVGKIWDASLMYSQVDKDFREDMLGEDARYRNAKLAYYRGDFDWAQGQLTVLKASTSELIANDALYLSVLITENIPPDSIMTPLNRFAYADLLMFQNKDSLAGALLDSISTHYPEHPLQDDILMQRANLAFKHRDYNKTLDYLKDIYVKFGKDVLGDDAVFRTAEIYEKFLHDNEKAKHFYEQLVIDYPGSTYVQSARTRLSVLQGGAEAPQ